MLYSISSICVCVCFTPRYFYHSTLYLWSAHVQCVPSICHETCTACCRGRGLGTVISEKRKHEKCSGTVTMPPHGYGIWYGSVSQTDTCTFVPCIFPCETLTENSGERRYCPRKDTINTRRAIATITLCTRCKRPELAGDEDIIALSVSLYTLTPFIASRSIFRREIRAYFLQVFTIFK